MTRSFLFLQGVCSPFFRVLGERLSAQGHDVRKVNFNVGDFFAWRKSGAYSYRRTMGELPDFYKDTFNEGGISDIVLFGDCRPVHAPAIAMARAQGIRIHVFEEGYFRPYWITLERDGVNANSRLSKDPEWFRSAAKKVPKYGNGMPFNSKFWVRAAHDVAYNFWAGLNLILHPDYESHVPYSPASEYLHYIARAARVKRRSEKDAATVTRVVSNSDLSPYYLLPLQLGSDAQIRHHSPYEDVADVLSSVVKSFAHHAPRNSRLVVKNHPLDPGFVDYLRVLSKAAEAYAVDGRVDYLESGHLPTLLSKTQGVVTVNSTVGGSALVHNCPTIALGSAIYDLAGLTFQNGLDRFWTEAEKPDRHLFECFRNIVIHTTQLNGGFYCRRGIEMAVENSCPRLTSERSTFDGL